MKLSLKRHNGKNSGKVSPCKDDRNVMKAYDASSLNLARGEQAIELANPQTSQGHIFVQMYHINVFEPAIMSSTPSSPTTLEILEKIVAESCDCKLREKCPDKSSPECLKHRDLYTEAVLANQLTRLQD